MRLRFVLYLLKVLLIVGILSVLRTIMARMRIDQMIAFCWQRMAPLAFGLLVMDLVIKGVWLS